MSSKLEYDIKEKYGYELNEISNEYSGYHVPAVRHKETKKSV